MKKPKLKKGPKAALDEHSKSEIIPKAWRRPPAKPSRPAEPVFYEDDFSVREQGVQRD